MYLRTVSSGRHEYVQMCHNYREGGSGPSRTRVLFSFGRKDELDVDALRRLVASISRYLDPAEAAEVRVAAGIELDLDAGFNSETNRRILQGAGDAADLRSNIIGERLRSGSKGEAVEASQRAGRYKTLDNGLRVKEVTIQQNSVAARRFVIVHNLEQERFDRERRDDIVRETERRLTELGDLTGKAHSKAACALRAHPTGVEQ